MSLINAPLNNKDQKAVQQVNCSDSLEIRGISVRVPTVSHHFQQFSNNDYSFVQLGYHVNIFVLRLLINEASSPHQD